jgi:hypothetical protein
MPRPAIEEKIQLNFAQRRLRLPLCCFALVFSFVASEPACTQTDSGGE